jgi:phospholipid/cholesterol/gamma-HCH transport system substrate-binding protein
MQSRVSYAAVGLFVIGLGIALVLVGLWLGTDVRADKTKRYSVYFEESVSGLYRSAPVRYRGVAVGEVERLALAENDPGLVHVVIEVAEDTPVKTDTKAKLDPQGVTGILHLELTGGTAEAPLLAADAGRPYPVIESTPSFITQLDQALTQSLATLDRLADQVSGVLSDQNQKNLEQTLANVERFTGALAANSARLESTLTQTEQLMASGSAAAEQLPALMAEIRQTLQRFEATAAAVEQASDKLGAMGETGQRELQTIGRTTVPEVNRLVDELQVLVDSLTGLSEELRANPRMLIFGRDERAPGPGE